MGDFPIYRSPRRARRSIKDYGLGNTEIAKMTILGVGIGGSKSSNIIAKSPFLERNGFIFPRRNIIIKADVLEEGIISTGERKGWNAEAIPKGELSRKAFTQWSNREIWPLTEEIFGGRSLYIRSDAFGDALGREAYTSVPFANSLGNYKDPEHLKVSFANGLFEVVNSYFSDTAKAFRKAAGILQPGMCVFLSQFIGQPSHGWNVLMPFMSAVVKTTLFEGQPGKGVVRFEYGMGKGALTGRSIVVEKGRPIETISGKKRWGGIYCSWQGARITGFSLSHRNEVEYEDSKWTALHSAFSEAYPLAGRSMDTHGKELLGWLVKSLPKLEHENGSSLYLELVSSSFQNRLRWFVVQVADYPTMNEIPAPPKDAQFVSNLDFYGHGEIKGKKEVFVFSRESFSTGMARQQLSIINGIHKDFVVVLPQEALTGLNLVELSGSCFSNASAVLEYQMLGDEEYRGTVHQKPSYEHFEQLARDLKTMFIPVEKLELSGFEKRLPPDEPLVLRGDVHIACDKERRIAWGSLRNLSE